MSDLKSKLPDLEELSSIAGKLFKDVKKSVVEIIDDYKKKHPSDEADKAVKKPVKKPAAAKKKE